MKVTNSSPWPRSIRKRPWRRNPKPKIHLRQVQALNPSMGMANQTRNPNEEMIFIRCICLFGASLAGCAACWWAAGTSLGLFFAGLFLVTFLTPAAILEQKEFGGVALGLAATVGPIAATWLIVDLKTSDTI